MPLTAATELLDDLRAADLLSPGQLDAVEHELKHLRTARQLADELLRRQWLTQFQVQQVIDGFAHELNLGRYRLFEVIGQGGMGVVFKAQDQQLGRFVALKTIHQEVCEKHPDALRRFEREARAIAQLQHANVVVLYEKAQVDGIHFLAMEFVEGIDLHRMVAKQGALPIKTACEYIRQAAAGLQHAHEFGLIHRDIKPSNLLVTRPNPARLSGVRKSGIIPVPPLTQTPMNGRATGRETVKILDLGLARLSHEIDDASKITALTQAGAVIGTPDFIAPEQAIDATTVDHRADLYSLGCTFYFLLTGRAPFPDGTSVEKLAKHQTAQPWPLEQIRRGVPAEVLGIVRRLMEKKPDQRFQTAQEVVEALAGVLETTLTERPSGETSAAVVTAARPAAESPRQAGGGDNLVIPARKAAVLRDGHSGYVTALAFTRDGRHVASGGLDGVVNLWDVGGQRPERIACLRGGLGEVQAIAFHPHKQYLVTGSAAVLDGHMWQWHWTEPDEHKSRRVLPGEPFRVDAMAFSADGRRLAASAETMVFLWADTRRRLDRESVGKGPGSPIKSITFCPEGRRLAIAFEDATIRVYEFGWFKMGQKAVCEGHTHAVNALAYSPDGKWLASGGPDRTIRIWDTSKAGAVLPTAELQGHSAPVRLLQFTSRSDLLVSVGDGGQVFLWDIAARTVAREMMIEKSLAYSMAMTPDARWLATGTNEGHVVLFDLEVMLAAQLPDTQPTL